MATTKKGNTEIVSEDEREEPVVEQLRRELKETQDLADKTLQAKETLYKLEIDRLQGTIDHLQRVASKGIGPGMPVGPEKALSYIISLMHSVAIGGAAAVLRQGVHTASAALDIDGKKKLQEFASRLRSAAEAVDQEAATLLL